MRETQQRALYHRFAWAYDLIVERPGGPDAAAAAATFAQAGLGAGAALVDAGCGTGAYASALAAHGFRVTAVDRSPELVAEARARAVEVELVCADFTSGWAPAGAVDGVLCRGVLNDLLGDDERDRALRAFAAWLKPGGVLLADVRDGASSAQRYAGGRTFGRTVRRGEDVLTFTSTTAMSSGLLRLDEHWRGSVGGAAVDEQNRFTMRCWTWESFEGLARSAGFRSVSRLAPGVVGAREDRLVALARR